jgi:hypothetical protein
MGLGILSFVGIVLMAVAERLDTSSAGIQRTTVKKERVDYFHACE